MIKKIIELSLFLAIGLMASDKDRVLLKQAKEFGFTNCITTVKKLENHLAKDDNYGTWTITSQNKTKNEFLTATMELTYNDGSELVDLTIIPNNIEKTCSFTYTRTWFSNKNCIATSSDLKDFEFKAVVNKNISAFSKKGINLLLMPVGNGCMVQKKETSFRLDKQDK